ncbi:MAG: magnesium chelatase subunit D family protein [Chloroflexaceae bacterium]|nr:magnesium chelatase subunit D family protein [Chloroflexaceae bacterium]
MSVLHSVYPFSALVGQERLKRALILNAINPRIGGVLIRGEKGTAKSTAVRGLARLLPTITVVAGCPYSCAQEKRAGLCPICSTRQPTDPPPDLIQRPMRLVELPVSASEDRVVGALDLEHAITEGQRRFEPGILAQVNRGLLYVDEVNLLDDHLVDVLLDAAAMGVNTVEREGISISHPSRFILVGTMNPEEGDLRPQLLDRFGLAVEIHGLTNVIERVAVIERRMAYEANTEAFLASWQESETQLAQGIEQAQQLLPHVGLTQGDLFAVAGLVLELGVDGHRADLTILETARTHAAWAERTVVMDEDILLAAQLALPHRMRRQPFGEVHLDERTISAALERSQQAYVESGHAPDTQQKKNSILSQSDQSEPSSSMDNQPSESASGGTPMAQHAQSGAVSSSQTQPAGPGKVAPAEEPPASVWCFGEQRDTRMRKATGRRSTTRTMRKQGRYVTHRIVERVTDLAFDATLRVAAIHQPQRRMHREQVWGEQIGAGMFVERPRWPALIIERYDLRQKVRIRRTRNAVCFVVDASWSMSAQERMQTTKAAILGLLRDAYQRRDRVGLVSFQRDYATVLLPLTSSVELAQRCLETMPTGGKTPLARGLLTGYDVLNRARYQDAEVIPLMVLITDAQANVALGAMSPQVEVYQVADFIAVRDIPTVVIDTEHPNFQRGLARQLAYHLQGQYYRLDELREGGLEYMVRARMRR